MIHGNVLIIEYVQKTVKQGWEWEGWEDSDEYEEFISIMNLIVM